jgi:hypothetical protein
MARLNFFLVKEQNFDKIKKPFSRFRQRGFLLKYYSIIQNYIITAVFLSKKEKGCRIKLIC